MCACVCVTCLSSSALTSWFSVKDLQGRSITHLCLSQHGGPGGERSCVGARSLALLCRFAFFFLLPCLLPFLTFPLLLFSSPLSSSLFPFSLPHSIHASPCLPDTCSNNLPFLRRFRASLFNLSVHPFTRPLYIPVASDPQPLMKID